jgi:hypothetical protein
VPTTQEGEDLVMDFFGHRAETCNAVDTSGHTTTKCRKNAEKCRKRLKMSKPTPQPKTENSKQKYVDNFLGT